MWRDVNLGVVQECVLEDYKEGLGAENRKIGSKRVKI